MKHTHTQTFSLRATFAFIHLALKQLLHAIFAISVIWSTKGFTTNHTTNPHYIKFFFFTQRIFVHNITLWQVLKFLAEILYHISYYSY